MFLRWCSHWRNFIHSLNSAQKSVRAVHRQCADNIKPPWQGGHEGRREGGHQDNVGLCLPRVSRSMSLVSQQVCLRFEFHLPIFASPPYKHPTALEMMSWQASVRHGGGLAAAVLEDSRTITLSSQPWSDLILSSTLLM